MASVCRCGGIKEEGKPCNRCGGGARLDNRSAVSKEKQKAYTTERWIRVSRWHRTRWPFCNHCEMKGKTTPIAPGDGVGQLDHIKWCEASSELFWLSENHQGLCKSCHSIKTNLEMRGKYTREMIQRDMDYRAKQMDEI